MLAMNLKKGFKRLTFFLSIIAFLIGGYGGLGVADDISRNSENVNNFMCIGIIILSGLISFAVVWIIYRILSWLISGFY